MLCSGFRSRSWCLGTKCSRTAGRSANSALSLLVGICFHLMVCLPEDESPGRRLNIHCTFFACSPEGQIYTSEG